MCCPKSFLKITANGSLYKTSNYRSQYMIQRVKNTHGGTFKNEHQKVSSIKRVTSQLKWASLGSKRKTDAAVCIYRILLRCVQCGRQTHWRQGALCALESPLQSCEQSTGIFLRLLAAPCVLSARWLCWLCSEDWPVWREGRCPYTTLSGAGAHLSMKDKQKLNISVFFLVAKTKTADLK